MKTSVGVLFDLDGTLVDTAPDLLSALSLTLQDLGKGNIDVTPFYNYASDGSIGLLEAALGPLSEQERTTLKPLFLDNYAKVNTNQAQFFEGILPLITSLESQGYPWGIITNKPARFAKPLIEVLDCQPSVIICGDSCTKAKPNPEPMFLGAQQLGVECERIYYLGDAKRDIEAATNSQMISVAVEWGYIKPDDSTQLWQPNYTISHPLELLPLIQSKLG